MLKARASLRRAWKEGTSCYCCYCCCYLPKRTSADVDVAAGKKAARVPLQREAVVSSRRPVSTREALGAATEVAVGEKRSRCLSSSASIPPR